MATIKVSNVTSLSPAARETHRSPASSLLERVRCSGHFLLHRSRSCLLGREESGSRIMSTHGRWKRLLHGRFIQRFGLLPGNSTRLGQWNAGVRYAQCDDLADRSRCSLRVSNLFDLSFPRKLPLLTSSLHRYYPYLITETWIESVPVNVRKL